MSHRVLILGAGLAGLAAASALASRGLRVSLLESRLRTGGRASSFTDPTTGQLIDACQHVSMGCCTNLAHFCRTIGIAHLLERQPRLYFMTPDRRISTLSADPLPAPLHLARSFLQAHYLSWSDKLRVSWGLARLRLSSPRDDRPFADWLRQHGQTPGAIERFWSVIVVSALNEEIERVSFRHARKVFVDGFLRHRRGFEVELPTVPLGQFYGSELADWLRQHQVELLLNHAVTRLVIDQGRIAGVELRSGGTMQADWYISAVPFDRLLALLPGSLIAEPYFGDLRRLETSPITSVHLWYDRSVVQLPHVVLVGCVGQWLFNRGSNEQGEQYVQVVVSASRDFRDLDHAQVKQKIVSELQVLFPEAALATLVRHRVVTEHAATFSAAPGVDRWRPVQTSPLANLFVAGDWTRTQWPATMEGAVRSGYLAAEALLRRLGRPERLLQADL